MIVSMGSVNADFLVRVAGEVRGPGHLLATDLLRTSGGKAANVAVFVRRLGMAVRLVGCVGDDDLAVLALRGPRSEGVDLDVRSVDAPTGSALVLVEPGGSKLIAEVLGANGQLDDFDAAVLSPAVTLVVDVEIPPATAMRAVESAKAAGCVVVLDPSPADAVEPGLLALADHVTPNHREAGQLTGTEVADETSALHAAVRLRATGAGAAYVKLPGGGCALDWDGGQIVVTPPDVSPVDATGAGDAFAAAVAWAAQRGVDPPAAAAAGVAGATCAVRAYGSQESYPTLDELEAMIRQVTVTTP